MTLRITLKTEKSHNAQIYIDDRCVGTLPLRVLPLRLIPEIDIEADENLVSEIFRLLKSRARELLLDYLAKAEHSEWQSRLLLKRHKFDQAITDELIQYAKDHRFIDDSRYADIYIRSWLNRGIGRRLLASKLSEQHIKPSVWKPIIEEVYNPEEYCDSLIESMKQYICHQKELPYKKLKEKTFSYFIRKGFELDQIHRAWEGCQGK